MIIDFKADPDHAKDYDILDEQGWPIIGVVYADDDRGMYTRLTKAAKGGYQHRDGVPHVATVHAVIRIVARTPKL